MDRFNAMRVFTRIVELGGFARAAESLHMPRASVTILIKQLEAHLGVQLLQRTTRQVSTTPDGKAYYQRCVSLLADLDDAEASFSAAGAEPKGLLRVDLPVSLGRMIVIPALPEFARRYPQIRLEIGMSDRPVDLIREGVDCVLRAGAALDETLVARPLDSLTQITCASRDYLQRCGTPLNLPDLAQHQVIEYFSTSTGKRYGLEFMAGGVEVDQALACSISVNSADGYVAACEAGFGLIQVPRYHVAAQLRSGVLVEVLRLHRPPPLALTVLYPPHRQLSRRIRVFVDWLVELCAHPDIRDRLVS
ncbi:LysR family transcriptional regulator [Pseudomonas amygdali pv. lachrymans]|uniref:LysR family transcriptional regulator n=2 Tax=Pseudomonas amygdali pv. lachrymans TaxID=53707 RepID=A0ABR5KW54_PSEAV|nr:LysR family transcriptional regulator [Pseudomonas amygdali]AXH56529.1 LysR family transcriptional regulator [Pseudomonas amygdali pv. lachrymans str. M301315]KPC19019.1 LysR family transcriptional regulator [Pseudomonas amygdali pv. lachrymans]PWD03873.1 LysR family transcriptional regulator [Pseudomonas amygdali pv. lachrymans]QWA47925.1 LysR family transcriptional regulator [Pseudomonas amygdali pv. lachrymans]